MAIAWFMARFTPGADPGERDRFIAEQAVAFQTMSSWCAALPEDNSPPVARGGHDDYLRELHWYETARWARYHWSCLHAAAVDSLTRDANWASKPELAAVRGQILRLPQPTVPDIRLSPDEKPKFERGELT